MRFQMMGRCLGVAAALLLGSFPAVQAQTAPAKRAPTKAAPASTMVLEPRAMELLKATSEKLASAKALSFTAVASYEYPSKLGPPILYTVRHDVAMRRPDRLRVIIPGDGPASEFYYDGKAIMAYAPAENLVAVADAPPSIDGALAEAYKLADIYYPFTDLLVADPYKALVDGAILAFYIGPSGVVGGVKTEMVAWANKDVFLQIWIGAEDKLPRRVRAVYRNDPARLRHELDLSNWQVDSVIADEAFGSSAAKAAQPMSFKRPATPPAVKPIVKPIEKPGAKPAAKATP